MSLFECLCVKVHGLQTWKCSLPMQIWWKSRSSGCICEKYIFLKISPNHCPLPSLIGHSFLLSGKIHQGLGSKMETQNLNQLLLSIFCLLTQELRPGEFNYSFQEHIFVLKGRSLNQHKSSICSSGQLRIVPRLCQLPILNAVWSEDLGARLPNVRA